MNQTTHWQDILQLGDPRLREPAREVLDVSDSQVTRDAARVHDALESFRTEHGRGRGTAAPQLGINRRLVALAIPDFPEVIFNPRITWRSSDTMTLWEGCMSFPFLLVRTARSTSISVEFTAPDGQVQQRDQLDPWRSELLQHEFDHLDGVLAVDHATDANALLSRELFNRERARFTKLVDYTNNHVGAGNARE
jgi:peptide deformylase